MPSFRAEPHLLLISTILLGIFSLYRNVELDVYFVG